MPRFEKGNPGGPGRPRGSRNVANIMLDQVAEGPAETGCGGSMPACAGSRPKASSSVSSSR